MQTQRKLLIMFISLILAFSVFLTACDKSTVEVVTSAIPSAKPAVTAEKHDPVTITMSWWGNDDRNKALSATIKLFEQKYNWIKVEGTGAGWDGYHDKLTVRLSTKKAPDLFAYSPNFIQQYSAGGMLINDNDYLKALPFLSDIKDLTAQFLSEGKLYGVPAGRTYGALLYDKQIFDDAKVPYPTEKDTKVSLFAKLAQIHKNNPKIWGEAGGLPEGFLLTLDAEGYPTLDYTTNPPRVNLHPEVAGKYLDFYEQQWAAGSSPGAVVDVIGIPNGNAATVSANVSGIASTISQTKHELGIMPDVKQFDSNSPKTILPAGVPAFWGIPSTSKHIDEALLLMNFLLTDPGAVKEIGLNYGTPTVPASLDYYSTLVKPGSLDETILNIAKKYVPPGFTIKTPGQLVPAGWGEALDVFNVNLQKYAQKQMTQKDFLAETEKQMNQKLQDNAKK